MTNQKREDGQSHMPLPAPKSPAALDEKILAYAKKNVPQRTYYRPLPWLAGLVTAGIVGVAVMISLPQQSPIAALDKDIMMGEAPAAATPAVAPAANMSAPKRVDRKASHEATARYAAKPSAAPGAVDAASAGLLSDSLAAAADTPAEDERKAPADDIRKQLMALRQLSGAGATKEASARYRALRASCADCNLPDTLQQALENHPPTEPVPVDAVRGTAD